MPRWPVAADRIEEWFRKIGQPYALMPQLQSGDVGGLLVESLLRQIVPPDMKVPDLFRRL